MSLLLNRTTAPMVIRFFDICFKQGVIDAYEYGDDLGAREFYEQKMFDWSFGLLSEPGDLDWQAFRFQLYWWARKNSMRTLAESYLFRIRTKTYFWCVLPYCMRFYLMGIGEWLKYPNPAGIEIFKGAPRVHWDPSEPTKKFTRTDSISYLHSFEFEFRNVPEPKREISLTLMSSFIRALFDLSRRYVTGKDEDLEGES